METLIQFEMRLRREFLAENAGITATEYIDCYPTGSRFTEWAHSLEQLAAAGVPFRACVLDDLYHRSNNPALFLRFVRDNGVTLPAGYLNPGARQANAA